MIKYGRLAYFICVLCGVFYSFSVSASYTATPVNPTTYTMQDGVWTTIRAKPSSADPSHYLTHYVTKNVRITPSTLARFAKIGMSFPGSAAIAAAIAAYDYYYNPVTNEFERIQAAVPNPVGTSAYYIVYPPSGTTPASVSSSTNSTPQSLCSLINFSPSTYRLDPTGGYQQPTTTHPNGRCIYNYIATNPNNTYKDYLTIGKNNCTTGSLFYDLTKTCLTSSPHPPPLPTVLVATDQIISESLSSNLSEDIIKNAIQQNRTGGGVWPEMTAATTEIANFYNNYYVNNNTTTTDPLVNAPTEVPPQEFPESCTWMPWACEFVEWMRDDAATPPAELPLPTVEPTMVNWSSGLSGGSCPSPVSISYSGWTGSFTFDTACWGAQSFFRPLLLALSLIAAGYIIVGVKS